MDLLCFIGAVLLSCPNKSLIGSRNGPRITAAKCIYTTEVLYMGTKYSWIPLILSLPILGASSSSSSSLTWLRGFNRPDIQDNTAIVV
jgi:hypothetical protein